MAFPGMTSAVAGLKSHMTAMNVIGNNISNVDTPSFKSGDASFRDTMYQDIMAGSAGGANGAGLNPSQVGYGSEASGVVLDQTKGSPNVTGRSSDLYINGAAYFVVSNSAKKLDASNPPKPIETTWGTSTEATFSGVKYTRVGSVQTDSNGYLTDGNGNYLLGAENTTGATSTTAPSIPTVVGATNDPKTLQALRLPTKADGTVDGPISNLAIAADGTVTCTKGDGTNVIVGRVAVATFPNVSGLNQSGNSYYAASQSSGTPAFIDPGTGSTNGLLSGELEASNVDLASQFSNMIMYERGYQANTKIVSVYDEMYQTLVNMK